MRTHFLNINSLLWSCTIAYFYPFIDYSANSRKHPTTCASLWKLTTTIRPMSGCLRWNPTLRNCVSTNSAFNARKRKGRFVYRQYIFINTLLLWYHFSKLFFDIFCFLIINRFQKRRMWMRWLLRHSFVNGFRWYSFFWKENILPMLIKKFWSLCF